ncbi:ATP-dependent RecD-like DNA helicase [bacterium]|nr:ATP-dependent RecD-like DNA helicase [bacterium]
MTHDQLTGIVDRFLFKSEENGFSVLILQTRTKDKITVRGNLPGVNAGQQITVSGAWVVHPKFGKQFEAKSCTACLPTSVLGLKKYLGSGLIKGIGPTYAEKLVNHFGLDVLTIIEETPQLLHSVEGIGPKRVEQITQAWKDQRQIAGIMVFLQGKGISTVYATKIYKTYGQEAVGIITENPYRLADDIWGIGFKKADAVAQQLGFEFNSLKRITSGTLFTLTQQLGKGHLYIELTQLKENIVELLELDKDESQQKIKMALHNLHDAGKIKVVSHDKQHFVTLSQHYYSEKGVAEKIKTLFNKKTRHKLDIQSIYSKLRTGKYGSNITLNEEQQDGIMATLQNKVTVITGGPGTGKTTLIKTLLSILEENKLDYKLAAPTGRAAKRIFEGTGRNASTIHRLLEFDFNTMSFTHNEQNALNLDFLIVDEASMIDIFLAFSLIKAIPLDAHIIFIGDIHQLPSVGSGNFLKDLIASETVTNVKLITIFRQAQDSLIIVNAHKINNGEFPVSHLPGTQKDYFFIKEDNPENVPLHLENIYKKGLKKFSIQADDSVVLVPMHRGSVGTQKLNGDLQNILNPEQTDKQLNFMGCAYKLGDRVMQLRNNYDKHVFNGDIGTIVDVNTEDQQMLVRYNNLIVEYEKSDLHELVLAYAISIHKSQGSEYSAAIITLFTQHFTLLQRNLIYTAITRAKKLCIFIGQPKAIAMGIKNNKSFIRKTFLKEYLTSDLNCL